MKKIAVFFDGSNFFHAKKSIGCDVEVERIFNYCKEQGMVVKATYYTVMPGTENERKFCDCLERIGYSLVTKSGNATFDFDIASDMFRMAGTYDIAILVSNDGDFDYVVKTLKSSGKEVVVISEAMV